MPIIIPSPISKKEPQIHESAYIAPTATIIGDVTIEEGVNIWFGAVLRGDWGIIKIGKKYKYSRECNYPHRNRCFGDYWS